MKKIEKDYEYLETSPEMQARGLKRISRPAFLGKIPKNVQLRDCKSRITIYLDADIVDSFKKEAEKVETGYQTLINQILRQYVDKISVGENSVAIKDDLLKDKSFLKKLKKALV